MNPSGNGGWVLQGWQRSRRRFRWVIAVVRRQTSGAAEKSGTPETRVRKTKTLMTKKSSQRSPDFVHFSVINLFVHRCRTDT
jgi:hypothetical protein